VYFVNVIESVLVTSQSYCQLPLCFRKVLLISDRCFKRCANVCWWAVFWSRNQWWV